MRIVGEATEVPERVSFIFGLPERLAELGAVDPSVPQVAVDEGSDLFLTESSQQIGAVCRIERSTVASVLESSGIVLALDQLADPGNVGTIIRGADWFGFRSLVATTGTVDPWNPKAVRSSMGGILRSRIATEVTPEELRAGGRPVIGLRMSAGNRLGEAALPEDAVYVVGSEATGLSDGIEALCTDFISIPGGGGESLNAAMASSILLWELFRLHQMPLPIDVED